MDTFSSSLSRIRLCSKAEWPLDYDPASSTRGKQSMEKRCLGLQTENYLLLRREAPCPTPVPGQGFVEFWGYR